MNSICYASGAVQAVVLAGGLATRMHPRTITVPKSLLEVGGRPFVDWQLERLAASGFRDIVMCVAYLGDRIRAHVGEGTHFGVRVAWVDEGPTLLGTGGALRNALDELEPTFLVTYGDSYLPFDYSEPVRVLERHDDCDGVMAVHANAGKWDASNVVTDGTWVLRYEKGQHAAEQASAFDHIDYGATALRREVVAALPPGQTLGLMSSSATLRARKRLRACVAHDRIFRNRLARGAGGSRSAPSNKSFQMIVSCAPVRFSLGGGGTDLPSYSRSHGGFVVAAAVDKFVFVCAARRFYNNVRLAYSESEIVDSADQVKHRIFRAALQEMGVLRGIELHSLADVPANSGLGSSSSFTVAVLNALHAFKREFVPAEQLAREACRIEMELLNEPIGKQRTSITAAYGGISALTFNCDGSARRRAPSSRRCGNRRARASNLVIYYSGRRAGRRPPSPSEQATTITKDTDGAVQRMHRIKALGHDTKRILLSGNVDPYGEMLHEHWTNKRKLASNMTGGVIDEHYEAARKAGAIGGKLMGAGGGGFFMFYVRSADRRRVHEVLAARGLRPLRFRFDFTGARIMVNFNRS